MASLRKQKQSKNRTRRDKRYTSQRVRPGLSLVNLTKFEDEHSSVDTCSLQSSDIASKKRKTSSDNVEKFHCSTKECGKDTLKEDEPQASIGTETEACLESTEGSINVETRNSLYYLDREGSNSINKSVIGLKGWPTLLTGLYCDICNKRLNEDEATSHLKECRHTSASIYQLKTTNMTEILPDKSLIMKADTFEAELPLSESSVIYVCKYCKKLPFISNSPLDIDAHHKDNHLNKPSNEHSVQYNYSEIVDTIQVDISKLVQYATTNTYPCIKCHEVFDHQNEAIKHMETGNHSYLRKFWTPGPDQQTVYIAKCETCPYASIYLLSNAMLLLHLIKVHGQYHSNLSQNGITAESCIMGDISNVNISIRSYQMDKYHSSIKFVNNSDRAEIYSKYNKRQSKTVQDKSVYLKSLRVDCGMESKQHEDLHWKSTSAQQYCCDLCQVPLGKNVNTVMRHMETFSHSSVSLYNTAVNNSGETTLVSIHNYGVYQDLSKVYCQIACRCTSMECDFISHDPIICHVHTEIAHTTKPENQKVDYFHLHTTTTYSITIDSNNRISCPTCGYMSSDRKELLNHLAGMKHQSLIEHGKNVLDIAKCQLCALGDFRGMFTKEIQLIDHLMKHHVGKATPNSQYYYTVSSFKCGDRRNPIVFETDWLKHTVTQSILKSLFTSPNTSKIMKKKYRAAYKHLREKCS